MTAFLTTAPYAGIFALILAPFLGSFCALLAVRLPHGEDVVFTRSHCSACGHVLRPAELVPIVSYVALRGRCARCRSQIPRLTLFFELVAVVLAIQAGLVSDFDSKTFAGLFLGLILLTIAAIDLKHFYIPDVLSLPLIAVGLLMAGLLPNVNTIAMVIGAASGYALLAFISSAYRYLRGRHGLGLGDAKLFAAAGAWVGWQGLPLVLLLASVSGIVAVLVLRLLGNSIKAQDPIPFGPFLALGFWLVWLYIPGL